MADIADLAQEHMERENEGFLTRHLKPTGPTATGFCHWCDEPVGENRRWCRDADCRDQWAHEQEATLRNGKTS